MNKTLLLAILLALLWSGAASAHLTPNSEVRLTFGPRDVVADIVIPQSEYAYATGAETDDTAQSRAAAARYLLARVAAIAPGGGRWRIAATDTRFETTSGPPDLRATLRLTPPPGAPLERFRLEWHAITREVPTHFALLVEGGDLSGRNSPDRRLIGTLTEARPTMDVRAVGGGGLRMFANSISLGAAHIIGGYDHLLFLLALLLPAPMLAVGGAWKERRGVRDAAYHLARIVTGFTIGHSATLIAAVLFNLRLPAAPVEALIALSVLISAVHAARPLFPGREPQIAMAFGLVHGLAFATLVSGLGIGRGDRLSAILGFNLGIEIVQLVIVAVCLPAILWICAEPDRARFRKVASAVIACAALVWLIERLLGTELALGAALQAGLPWLFAAVTVGSLVVVAAHLRRWSGARQSRRILEASSHLNDSGQQGHRA